MEANKILQADLLDIIFEGRNKSYGAYELRSTYNSRIKVAVVSMAGVCLLLVTGILLANSGNEQITRPLIVTDVKLVNAPDREKEKTIPEPVKPKPVEVHTIVVSTPIILPDILVPKTEVPTDAEVDGVKIGPKNNAGIDGEIVNPLIEVPTGQTELPVKKEEPIRFTPIQIEAKFPGGIDAWAKYLERNLNTNTPVDNGAASGNYSVLVSFNVDENGFISDVVALNDPGYGTAEEAVRVIKKSKQWIPALQNGRNVVYRQKQSITFVVNEG